MEQITQLKILLITLILTSSIDIFFYFLQKHEMKKQNREFERNFREFDTKIKSIQKLMVAKPVNFKDKRHE